MSKQKRMVYLLTRNVVIILLIALGLGLFIIEDKLAYTLGVLLGGATTIIKIFLMEHTFEKAILKDPNQATNYVRAQYVLRYVISFIVLFIGVYTPYVHLIGIAVGLFTLKPAAYIQGMLEPPVPKDGSVEFLEWEEEDEENKSEFW